MDNSADFWMERYCASMEENGQNKRRWRCMDEDGVSNEFVGQMGVVRVFFFRNQLMINASKQESRMDLINK